MYASRYLAFNPNVGVSLLELDATGARAFNSQRRALII